jgi:hypothetical protein
MIVPIVLFSHASRAGKDFTYKTLERIAPVIRADSRCKKFDVKRFAFADRLKTVVHEMFSPSCPQLRIAAAYEVCPQLRNEKILGTKTVVDLWIEVGEFFRKLDPKVWVHPVVKRLLQEQGRSNGAGAALIPVITDCRFPNELAEIKRLFPDAVSVEIVATHDNVKVLASDSFMKEVIPDYKIVNDGTDNFKGEVFKCFQSILRSSGIYAQDNGNQ